MNKKQILLTFKQLASSNGSYGRLYYEIENSPQREAILQRLEDMNFNDSLDLILFMEG